MLVCNLVTEVILGLSLYMSTPLGSGSLTTRVVKLVDVIVRCACAC